MTVLEVLKSSCLYLDVLDDFSYYFGSSTTQPTVDQQKYFSKLLSALNLVVKDISAGFVAVKTREEVLIDESGYNLANLSKSLFKVLSVYHNGVRKKFKIFDNFLKTEFTGKIVIEYSYYPNELALEDNLNFFNGKVSVKTLALGVCCEISYITSNFDEAQIWEDRFNNNLKTDLKDHINFSLPAKRWC